MGLFNKYQPLLLRYDGVIKNTTDDFNYNFIKESFASSNDSIFICVSNLFKAQNYYDALSGIVGEDNVLLYPADEFISMQMLLSNDEFRFERINTIYNLVKTNEKRIVITHLTGALRVQRNKEFWGKAALVLKKNDPCDANHLCNKLMNLGYEKVYTVEKMGQYAKRGSIIDIYPFNLPYACRLEVDFDVIGQIKELNIETQRSSKILSEIIMTPMHELIFDENEFPRAIEKINDFKEQLDEENQTQIANDIEDLKNRNNLDLLSKYISFFEENQTTIFDFRENKKIYLIEKPTLLKLFKQMSLDIERYANNKKEVSILSFHNNIHINDLFGKRHVAFTHIYDDISEGFVCDIPCKEVSKYEGNFAKLLTDLKDGMHSKKIILAFETEMRYDNFRKFLLDSHIPYVLKKEDNEFELGAVNLVKAKFASFGVDDILLINEHHIYDNNRVRIKTKYKSIYKNSKKIINHEELKIGDYIVHYDRGIGRYLGIKTIELDDLKRDYLYIEYAKEAYLYIAVEEISSIQKYTAQEGSKPKLSTIGGGDWAKTKAKVRNKLNNITDRLIQLYAKRKEAVGYTFLEDTIEEIEFAKDFGYEETSDQMQAIDDVKSDMMSSKPMDRLICGDVGYGKTEVALRGAFKAIMNGKQVIYLVPTTVLARQHYYTFKQRMEKFGVNVRLLSRMVSIKEKNETIAGLKDGFVDVVVGTHALLSNNIKFKDLGLLITDEEQRFGVTHKEKIKEMKVNVDSMMLSATPIPRTLQMSLLGIKELSMITTPPKNRYPVQTYVLARNDAIVKEAIERELSRDGQVFYLYNRVDSIEDMANNIKALVPEAKISIAHGRMDKYELEDTLIRFIEHESNVLVCTTIIETGIDIPDSNTLIIHDADNLGLSQLYQIRGRVGRSDKVAYAYLLYNDAKVLTEEAVKRLEVIKEFTELGSGFKIALRDLSIRGAGDLLGDEQSGFIDSVGLDLYMKMLEETIIEKQGLMKEKPQEITGNFKIKSNRSIKDSYISNDDVKIEIHKRIFKLSRLEAANDLLEELKDRFGPVDRELQDYIYEKLFDNLCVEAGVSRIIKDNYDEEIELILSVKKSENIDGLKIFNLANEISPTIKFEFKDNKLSIIYNKRLLGNNWLYIMSKFLDAFICL